MLLKVEDYEGRVSKSDYEEGIEIQKCQDISIKILNTSERKISLLNYKHEQNK